VIERWEGAETEESGDGLWVREPLCEANGSGVEVAGSGKYESAAVGVAADGLSEVADARFLLRRWSVEECQGVAEVLVLGW
jgi:hypothetical protein